MRTISSVAMALTVAGGLLGASLSASAAENLTDDVYYDGQFHHSYAQPYNGPESNAPTAYFYVDGQWQPSYEPVTTTASQTAPSAPTGHFFYDGHWHRSYS